MRLMITNVAQNVLIKAFLILECRMFLIRETCSGVYLRLKFHYLIQNHNEGISKIPIQNFKTSETLPKMQQMSI